MVAQHMDQDSFNRGIVDFPETVRCTFMQAFDNVAVSQVIFINGRSFDLQWIW